MPDSEFSIQRQLDEIRNEFEENWPGNGQSSRFDSFMDKIDEKHRDRLLGMLVEVDVELRKKAGESVSPEDYSDLGASVVARVARLGIDDSDVTTPPSRDPVENLPTTASQLPSNNSKRQIGPYKLLRELGKGGMGEVWLAEQSDPYRQVALKLVQAGRVQSDDQYRQFIARFEAERQALAMMSHTNIAKVFDGGTTEDGQPYFVMEYFSGVPLTKYCDNKKLGIKERLAIFVDVCRAVHHAHQKGIIHRDLKPDNILVTEVDDKPVPKVIDFGLAKSLQSTAKLTDKTIVSEVGIPLGTWQYMSPEQAGSDGMDVDTRTDIYALGAILYELLTGSPPIERETLANKMWIQMMELIQNFEPSRPSERLSSCGVEVKDSISSSRSVEASRLYAELKGELDWIVLKALEKDRSRRYGTASDFAEDVDNYRSGDAVEARPPSTGYKFRKFVGKNRGLVTSVAAIAFLLIAGLAGTTWFAWKSEKAAQQSETVLQIVIKSFRNERTEFGPKTPMTAEKVLLNAYSAISDSDLDLESKEKLLETLGASFDGIGEYASAVSIWEELLASRTDNLGQKHSRTLWVMDKLANSFNSAGRSAEAHELSKKTLSLRRETLGADHNDTIESMETLSICLSSLGRWSEVIDIDKNILEHRSRELGNDHEKTLWAMGNLARTYNMTREFKKAIELEEKVLKIRIKKLGNDHEDTLWAMGNLGMSYLGVGRVSDAIDLYEESVSLQSTSLGPNHPDTLSTMVLLAIAYRRAGRITEAFGSFREALKRYSKKFAPDHPATLEAFSEFMWAKVQAPILDTDSPVSITPEDLQQMRAVCQRLPLGKHFSRLGVAEYRLKNFEKAVAAAKISVEKTPVELGLSSALPIDFAVLAMSYKELGNDTQAIEHRRQLDKSMKLDVFKNDEECKSFLVETKTLFDHASSESVLDNR